MAYAITEYEFWGNPKVREAGKDAVLLYLAGNSYCNQFMTDGLITFAVIPTIANLAFLRNPEKAIRSLVDNRLWFEVIIGYQVHDYLKHNKSKAQIEDLINKRSYAGKAKTKPHELSNDVSSDATPVEQVIEQMPPSISYSISKDKRDVVVGSERGEVFKVYENEIGILTPFISDSIQAAERDYPDGWVIEAIHEAAINNGKSWKYIGAILQNWKQNGFKAPRQKQSATRYQKSPVNQGLEAVKAMAAEEGYTLDGIFSEVSNG